MGSKVIEVSDDMYEFFKNAVAIEQETNTKPHFIIVSKETHDKLVDVRYDYRLNSLDETIRHLIDIDETCKMYHVD